jgi:hypothetical protein
MAVGFFAFFGLTITLLRLTTLLQIPQHPAQITAIRLTTITSPANTKLSTTKTAADELEQKKLSSDLAMDRKWG